MASLLVSKPALLKPLSSFLESLGAPKAAGNPELPHELNVSMLCMAARLSALESVEPPEHRCP